MRWSIAPARACDLHHASLFTWLNGGSGPTQAAGQIDHSIEILLRVYVKCLKARPDRQGLIVACRAQINYR